MSKFSKQFAVGLFMLAFSVTVIPSAGAFGLFGKKQPDDSAKVEEAIEESSESFTLEDDNAAQTETQTTAVETPDLDTLSPEARQELVKLSEAIQQEHHTIANELRDGEDDTVKDIALLWQAAVEKSGTIRYAIENLSRRDGTAQGMQGESFSKRLLKSAAKVGGMGASIWTQTPTGLFGSSMVDEMLRGDPNVSAMTRVTDADMVILAKEVESLQAQVIESYYDYRHARERWELAQQAEQSITGFYDNLTKKVDSGDVAAVAMQPVVDSLYENIVLEALTEKQAFISSRNALGVLVGVDALQALEEIHEKEKTAFMSAESAS
ncbi:MAG: TolC family protein [Vampirovibrio sp.]|nr:TolC family protein [Vampirovibrio sp.]